MKKTIIVGSGLALACAGWIGTAAAEEAKALEGELNVGGTWVMDDIDKNESGAKGASEYQSVYDKDLTWDLGGALNYRGANNVDFDVNGRYRDGDDQEYGGSISLKRVLIYKTDYNRFLHRLDHDYMENLNAHIFRAAGTPGNPTGLPFTSPIPGTNPNGTPITAGQSIIGAANVYHTDHDPFEDYEVTNSDWTNSFKLNIPQLPALKIGFDHRYQKREGCKYAQTMSKCSGCHIESYSKGVDETTNDYIPKVSLQIEGLGVEYSYMHREFEDDSDEMVNGYNTLVTTHIGAFSQLLQFPHYPGGLTAYPATGSFTSGSEVLPFNRTPDSTKDSHGLKLRYDIDGHNTVTGGFVYSKTTNNETDGGYNALTGEFGDDLELESTSVMAKWHSRLTKALSLTVHGKYQTLDNDEVFVDVNDAAAHYKYTNEPADLWDFERASGYDLDVISAGVDAAWKVVRNITLRGSYEFHQEDRQNYEDHHVPETTDKHTFKLSGDWRLNHHLKFDLGYKLELIDDPYALHHAVCAPDGTFLTYAGPGTDGRNFDRTYAPNIYDARTGTRTNQPEMANTFTFKGHWNPVTMLSTSLHAKYRMAENDDVGGTEWQQDLFTAGIDAVLTPDKKFTLTGGYNYFYDKYESMYCIAIYDG